MAIGAVLNFIKTGGQALLKTGGAGRKAVVRGFKGRAALKGNAFSKAGQIAQRSGTSMAGFWRHSLTDSQRLAAATVGAGSAGLVTGYNANNRTA